jgi:N-acyl-D-amino-acid deacylase
MLVRTADAAREGNGLDIMNDTSVDLVIRNGIVVDGTGAEPLSGDVAVRDGRIVGIGPDLTVSGKEEVDARGRLVTPGFVDIHTHYDGQVTWDGEIAPSSAHGVTTVLTGNCGVGFAPCRRDDHEALIELMSGVEDIPEVVMSSGLEWNWQSFPEYLDAVEARGHDVDVATMLPHSALRVFVMGQRAIDREIATEADIEAMAALGAEAVRAGALGFGTSRALQQKSTRGEPIPTVRADREELRGVLAAMAAEGSGVFQVLSDFGLYEDVEGEFAMLTDLVRSTGRPLSFTLNQRHEDPDRWRQIVSLLEGAAAEGLPIKAQVSCRPTGLLLGHTVSRSPFSGCATYAQLAALPLPERITQLRRPDIRAEILSQASQLPPQAWDRRFVVTDPPEYEPDSSQTLASIATRRGLTPWEVAYDVLLEADGRQLIFHLIENYAAGSLDVVYEMITHPNTVIGLGDGGAHLGLICDASYPTTMLSYWARDRSRGPGVSLPAAVQALTDTPASTVGLHDRGRLAEGYKADINIIDHERLQLRAPTVVHDLPGGGKRIVQEAEGFLATFVNGVPTRLNGRRTDHLPGRLVRGARSAPGDLPVPVGS